MQSLQVCYLSLLQRQVPNSEATFPATPLLPALRDFLPTFDPMGNTLRRFQAWLYHISGWPKDKNVNIDNSGNTPSDVMATGPSETRASSDTSTGHSDTPPPTTYPPPYNQGPQLRELPRQNILSEAETSTSVIAAVCTAGIKGGPDVARAAANVIDHASCAVVAVPAPEAPVTARLITTAVTNYAAAAAAQPGIAFATIMEEVRNSVPVASIPGVSEYLPEALSNIDYAISNTTIPCANSTVSIGATIARAVAQVNSDAASLSHDNAKARDVANVYSHLAKRTAAGVDEALGFASRSRTQRPSDAAGREASVALNSPSTGSCEGLRQVSRFQAAHSALRDQASSLGHVRTVNALASLAAGARFPSDDRDSLFGGRCTCGQSPKMCEAELRADRLRAAIHALWTYNAMAGNREAANALGAVATAAGFPPPPEYPNVDQDARRCQTMLQGNDGPAAT
jgi:hypothetical protein